MKIILYSTGCPRCKVLTTKLNQAGIEYEIENNIEKMLVLGIENVPILSVDGELKEFKEAIDWIGAR